MFSKSTRSHLHSSLSATIALGLVACQPPETIKAGNSTATVTSTATSMQINAVCNPLGNGNSLGGNHGLQASLYYAGPQANLPEFTKVDDYINQGVKADANIFFDQVNVPTRSFSEGFFNSDGEVLTNLQGNTLYEWFSLDFQTVLKLAPENQAGNYQFALISDDGAVLEQEVNGVWQPLISADNFHPTQVNISSEPVYLDANSELPLRIKYFQGPRYNIAIMLLWRPWPSSCQTAAPNKRCGVGAECWNDPLNGKSGNEMLFDWSKNPSVPNATYQSFLSRGWNVIPPVNYYLPGAADSNPCTDTSTSTSTSSATDSTTATTTSTSTATDTSTSTSNSALSIMGFDGTTTTNSASMIWQTPNDPALGSLRWGTSPSALNNTVMESGSDVTTHLVIVPGLLSASTYYFQVSATDATGNTVLSPVISKTTK